MVNIHIFSCFFQIFFGEKNHGLVRISFYQPWPPPRHAPRQGAGWQRSNHAASIRGSSSGSTMAKYVWRHQMGWSPHRSTFVGKMWNCGRILFLRSYHIILTHRCHMSIVDCRTAEKRSLAENGCLQTWIVDVSINNSCIFSSWLTNLMSFRDISWIFPHSPSRSMVMLPGVRCAAPWAKAGQLPGVDSSELWIVVRSQLPFQILT